MVRVAGPGDTHTAFAQRTGAGELPGYDSLLVPLPVTTNGGSTTTKLTVTMSHEDGSPWPDVLRLVAVQYTLPTVANGTAGETSTASRTVQVGPHADSVASSLGYATGKLTDGIVSPSGTWNWDGSVGWNFFDGQFTVTIDLGAQFAISSVDLITHLDQSAAVNWSYEAAAGVGVDCAPRETGIVGQTCIAAGTSGQATLATRSVDGSPLETAGTISLPVADMTGRYVTVTGAGTGWVLLDEIRVKDSTGAIVSTGKPYTISPVPSVGQGQRTAYGDDSSKLVDGVVNPEFGLQFAQMFTGIAADTGGDAQVTWQQPHRAKTATVWIAEANPDFGVVLPVHVTATWRDENDHWQSGGTVASTATGDPSPYIRFVLPSCAQVTGIRVEFPGGSRGWYMISEISTQ
jgi:hypothetical protein